MKNLISMSVVFAGLLLQWGCSGPNDDNVPVRVITDEEIERMYPNGIPSTPDHE